MKRILFFFRSFKKIKTVKKAEEMGLIHSENIHGDSINYYKARSLWVDKYGWAYFCDELFINN